MICPECERSAKNQRRDVVQPGDSTAYIIRRYKCECGYRFRTREEWEPHLYCDISQGNE